MTPTPLFKTVVIAGVGLIGGSVALGLKDRFLAERVIGFDVSAETLTAALALGVIDEAQLEPGEWLREAELIVLASPVGSLGQLAAQLAPFAGPDTIFTDVGSVKGPLAKELAYLRSYVPGHPMAGSERGGVENAQAALLENAIWVLTPDDRTPIGALKRVRTLVESLGASAVTMPADAHDQLVATVSHLPYLSALALTHMVTRDERLALLAAGGFRDLTRVASGDPRMSRDMVLANREALREAATRFQRSLEHLLELLDTPEALLEAAEEGKRTRDSLPVVRRSLLPPLFDLVVAVPDQPGQLGRITQVLGEHGVNIKNIEVLAIRDQGGAVRLGFATLEEMEQARELLHDVGYRSRTRA
ncbi:prephenate dehydrogenase [Deinobacterium chartae]|uniref:Prephenate dehydrogenase n=1 Tax=Deinobacterium chartae TaxID=521158 RepID=A0A841HXG5_9DEIO|nr:prephenate dehydrogenase [Deinobacterium chartae]MBB6096652.1 prephenate dehydrogenase [Deinobacterium chartae]